MAPCATFVQVDDEMMKTKEESATKNKEWSTWHNYNIYIFLFLFSPSTCRSINNLKLCKIESNYYLHYIRVLKYYFGTKHFSLDYIMFKLIISLNLRYTSNQWWMLSYQVNEYKNTWIVILIHWFANIIICVCIYIYVK